MSEETKRAIGTRDEDKVTHKQFLKELSKMHREDAIDTESYLKLMDMAGKMSHNSYSRGLDRGQEIFTKYYFHK